MWICINFLLDSSKFVVFVDVLVALLRLEPTNLVLPSVCRSSFCFASPSSFFPISFPSLYPMLADVVLFILNKKFANLKFCLIIFSILVLIKNIRTYVETRKRNSSILLHLLIRMVLYSIFANYRRHHCYNHYDLYFLID